MPILPRRFLQDRAWTMKTERQGGQVAPLTSLFTRMTPYSEEKCWFLSCTSDYFCDANLTVQIFTGSCLNYWSGETRGGGGAFNFSRWALLPNYRRWDSMLTYFLTSRKFFWSAQLSHRQKDLPTTLTCGQRSCSDHRWHLGSRHSSNQKNPGKDKPQICGSVATSRNVMGKSRSLPIHLFWDIQRCMKIESPKRIANMKIYHVFF